MGFLWLNIVAHDVFVFFVIIFCNKNDECLRNLAFSMKSCVFFRIKAVWYHFCLLSVQSRTIILELGNIATNS